jgi:hypothetical protein
MSKINNDNVDPRFGEVTIHTDDGLTEYKGAGE